MHFSQSKLLGFIQGAFMIQQQTSERGLILLDLPDRLGGDFLQGTEDQTRLPKGRSGG
jgi:hypothetical protein